MESCLFLSLAFRAHGWRRNKDSALLSRVAPGTPNTSIQFLAAFSYRMGTASKGRSKK